MLSTWIVLPLLFAYSPRFVSSSMQKASQSEALEVPSCEQLRAFWETVTQATRIGHLTNEIPLIPFPDYNYLNHIPSGLRRRLHQINSYGDIYKDTIMKNFDAPGKNMKIQEFIQPESFPPFLQPYSPSDQDINGIFGEFHEPSEESQIPIQPLEQEMIRFGSSSAVPLSDKKKHETEFYTPQWGLPEEVDTFGSFIDFDKGLPHTAMTRSPKDSSRRWQDESQGFEVQGFSQVSCKVLKNTPCSINEQCICQESTLMCINSKCLNLELNKETAEAYGVWHDGPVPQPQVRRLKRLRKRSSRFIFM